MATKALELFWRLLGGFCIRPVPYAQKRASGPFGPVLTVLGHPAGCFVAQHPRTAPVLGGVLRLAVGESGQPPQVPPVGAVQVGSVLLRKVLASDGGHLRRQRPIRQTRPCLVV